MYEPGKWEPDHENEASISSPPRTSPNVTPILAKRPLVHAPNCGDVGHRLPEWRDAAVFVHRSGSGIVRSKGQIEVSAEGLEQELQVARSTEHVLTSVQRIGYAEVFRGGRHELHEAESPNGRDSIRIESRFARDDGSNQSWVDAMRYSGFTDDWLIRASSCRAKQRVAVVKYGTVWSIAQVILRAPQLDQRTLDIAIELNGGDRVPVVLDHNLSMASDSDTRKVFSHQLRGAESAAGAANAGEDEQNFAKHWRSWKHPGSESIPFGGGPEDWGRLSPRVKQET